MKYSKTLANNEIDGYIDVLEDLIIEKIGKNFHKDRRLNIEQRVDKYLDELNRGGAMDLLFPFKSSYKFLANKWRKKNCTSNSRPLKTGEFHPYCENYTGPGTRLNYNLKNNIKPVSGVDRCSKKHDIQYHEYFNIKNKDEREKKIREADKEALKCYDKYKNDKAYKLARNGIFNKTRLEDVSPSMAKKMLGLYKGGCQTCQSGGCSSCNENTKKGGNSLNKKDLKYLICDKFYCFSFKQQGNNYPIAKLGKTPIYINRENQHNNSCEGKMIVSSNPNKKFELVPNLNRERDCIYISAPSGSGKSYYAKQYAKKYKFLYPERKIYLFAKKREDPSLDDINPIRLNIDEKFLEDKIKMDYSIFSKSLVIFDDIEDIAEPDIKNLIMKIGKQILNLGRSEEITIIMISHMTMGGFLTKNILTECNVIVLFPKSGSFYQYIQYLNNYLGIPKKDAKKILNINSRSLTIFRECPLSFMTENKIYMNMIDD